MYYVKVLVADNSFHGKEALTYSSETELFVGTIVFAPLRNKQCLALVIGISTKPSFATKVVQPIINLPVLPQALLQTLLWMTDYYPAPLGVITQLFLPKSLPKKPVTMPDIEKKSSPLLPHLTADQQQALNTVQPIGTHLLHGQTGTGKTRVYIELALKALIENKSSIIVTPEIGLTSQLAQDMMHVFGNRVFIIHSQLTEVTRQRLWVMLLKQTEPVIIIGARSALFCPINNVGLVVVDESHETAYKQDQAPYYHASRLASVLAQYHACPLIMGSATPLITDYYMAEQKKRPIITMTMVAASDNTTTKTIEVVDLKDRSSFTRKPFLSNQLLKAMNESLHNNEQILLFLNRRGTARVVFCEKCGWQSACPRCDLALVYHGDLHIMRCHSCNYQAPPPLKCSECSNNSVIFRSIGTKAIVDEITKLFPHATVGRYDTDNKKTERIEHNYQSLKDGTVNIIIGTQSIAKGLDLPRLGLVGVLIADTSLSFPDFSAQERTYQLLGQVVGRVGRGHRSGKVVIQTYEPQSPLLQSVLTNDWRSFYKSELLERKTFTFPPFCYLLKLSCRRASSKSAEKASEMLVATLRTEQLDITIEGPAPAFKEKVQDKYEWQVIIKAKRRPQLVEIIRSLPSGWSYDIDPMNLL